MIYRHKEIKASKISEELEISTKRRYSIPEAHPFEIKTTKKSYQNPVREIVILEN